MTDVLNFQNYLVVFVDHLGQRERLREITEIPTTDEEKPRFIEKIKESLGNILGTRDLFKSYFEASFLYKPNLDYVPLESRNEFSAALEKAPMIFYGMSDSVVVGIPLIINNENCAAINSILDAFLATCGIGLASLSIGVPMRGGLDVGVATQIDNNEIYGPALERAFYLESELAEYPRFLVGRELIHYLSWVENQKNRTTRTGLAAKGLARFCREMIITDTDGRFMLDFLGTKVKEATGGSSQKHVSPAFKFVNSQYEKYSKEGNEKLASRYYRLLRYFNSRKKIWDVS